VNKSHLPNHTFSLSIPNYSHYCFHLTEFIKWLRTDEFKELREGFVPDANADAATDAKNDTIEMTMKMG
jgi:hypothetical protein